MKFSSFWDRIKDNWFFKSRQVSVRSGLSILIYLVLLCLAVYLFYLCNNIPTRSYNIEAEMLKTNWNYKKCNSVGGYYEPYIGLTLKIPMSMQVDTKGMSFHGKLIYNIQNIHKDIHKDTTIIDRYNYYANCENDSLDSFVNNNIEDIYGYHLTHKNDKKDVLNKWNDIHDVDEIEPKHKSNVFGINLLLETNERFWDERFFGSFTPTRVLRKYTGTNIDDECIGVLCLDGRQDSLVSRNIFYSTSPYLFGDIDQEYGALATPSWFNLSDISQGYFNIKIDSKTISNIRLSINFCSVTNFSVLSPEPDEITMSTIVFSNPYKLKEIKEKGLHFHSSFPEMQNKQTVRVFTLTTIMSLLFTALLKDLIIISLGFVNRRNKNK